MKPFVFIVITRRIFIFDRSFASLVCLDQSVDSIVCHARSCKSTTGCFKFRHCLEHFEKLDRAGLPNENAPAGYLLGHARQDEPLKGLPYGCTRYAKLLGQLDLVKTFAVPEFSCEDKMLQGVSDLVCTFQTHV